MNGKGNSRRQFLGRAAHGAAGAGTSVLSARSTVLSGDCTNCARCVPACPEGSLSLAWRPSVKTPMDVYG